MAQGYTLKFGENKEGKAVRMRNAAGWRVMPDVDAKTVQTCALEVWSYPGHNEGKTMKEICAEDAEWLEMMLDFLHPTAKHMVCARVLIQGKK